ncbi:MAG TPA: hypothetical protein ENI97_04020 [Gammaproteobacteria bacterium]|nr:hypothetical protein [Gammaproteobacteria bacterium]
MVLWTFACREEAERVISNWRVVQGDSSAYQLADQASELRRSLSNKLDPRPVVKRGWGIRGDHQR